MDGIKNFLQFVNDNWTTITIIISLGFALYQKIRIYCKKSKQERIDAAKQQVTQIALKLITDAELDYETWKKAGSIKRAQVIQQIFEGYPILAKVADQSEIVEWLDALIEDSLKELHEIVNYQEDDE